MFHTLSSSCSHLPFSYRLAPSLPTTYQSSRKEHPTSANAVTASSTQLRHGLSTPPEDMTDLALKPSLTSALGHGGAHAYNHFPGPLHTSVNKTASMAPLGLDASTVQGSRQQQPPSLTSQMPDSEARPAKEGSIALYLQVPSSICPSGGSLADFAAQITCLFWFAKTSKLKQIEESAASPYYPCPPLDPESIPSIGFRKWMTTILSTTQVSRNVVLLALLFIYRLKKSNSSVRGKRGSEFRLMTIALMMGNKFLDDNTYTNKTWAEVSGISIQEIHVMEVEFLSNVRYNLFVTKEEWEKWHLKLRVFSNYFSRASRLPLEGSTQPPRTPGLQISPSLTPMSASPVAASQPRYTPTLPSPTAMNPSGACQLRNYSTMHQPPPTLEPLAGQRKRSFDEQAEGHPPKKLAGHNSWTQPPSQPLHSHVAPQIPTSAYSTLSTIPSGIVSQYGVPVPQPSVPHLPTPALTVNTNATPSASGLPNQLPLPVNRAMSTVYTPVTTSWTQQTITPTLPVNLPSVLAMNPDLSRRPSPYPINSSTNISPSLSAYSSQTPTRLSPTSVLDRNSPYRPVRAVNTLLYPPPATSLQPTRQFPMDMMHYQSLGRPVTERRSGVLPYYTPSDGGSDNPYPQSHPSQSFQGQLR